MGCISSRPSRHNDPSVDNPATNGDNTSSSRAITTDTADRSTSPDDDPPVQVGPIVLQSSSGRRRTAPAEQLNSPLRPPRAWKSKRAWTRRKLAKERQEFFETRVTGRPEVWETLKAVATVIREGDIKTAQSMLDAAAITIPTGSLKSGAYDRFGNQYPMPDYVLSEPRNLEPDTPESSADEGSHPSDEDESAEQRREDKGKAVARPENMIMVKARLSDRSGPDLKISLGMGQSVRALIRRIREEAKVPDDGKIRIVYMGKVLSEKKSLKSQGWQEGNVVNVMVLS